MYGKTQNLVRRAVVRQRVRAGKHDAPVPNYQNCNTDTASPNNGQDRQTKIAEAPEKGKTAEHSPDEGELQKPNMSDRNNDYVIAGTASHEAAGNATRKEIFSDPDPQDPAHEIHEDSSEYASECESDIEPARQLPSKPIFIPKTLRTELAAAAKADGEAIATAEKSTAEKNAFVKEITTKAINEQLTGAVEDKDGNTKKSIQDYITSGQDLIDDERMRSFEKVTDEEEEYSLWKARELSRLKRDYELEHGSLAEKAESEHLASIPEDERRSIINKIKSERRANRAARNTSNSKLPNNKHIGAFFGDLIEKLPEFQRDFHAPIPDDDDDLRALVTRIPSGRGSHKSR